MQIDDAHSELHRSYSRLRPRATVGPSRVLLPGPVTGAGDHTHSGTPLGAGVLVHWYWYTQQELRTVRGAGAWGFLFLGHRGVLALNGLNSCEQALKDQAPRSKNRALFA